MKSIAQPSYYFDHAAGAPLAPEALDAMLPYFRQDFANPSSLYKAARVARQAVQQARHDVASTLGAKPTEIVFTSGTTEGDNLAIQGVLRSYPGMHWVTTAIEHEAVLAYTKEQCNPSTVVPVKPNGIVETKEIENAITDHTVLVSVMMANNEIGTIQPISDIAKLVSKVRTDRTKRHVTLPLYLHSDAAQAAGYLDLHVTRLGVDLLTLGGSKMYGPKGTGILYVRHGTQLEPLIYGGGQERGRRSGTENVAGVVGLAKAFEIATATRITQSHRLTKLRDELIRRLLDSIPESVLNGDPKRRLPNNISLIIPGVEGEGLVLYLDQAGVQASTGSACTTGSLEPSHVLLSVGRTPAEANCSLRLTSGRSTSSQAIEHVATVLPGIVQRLREL